MAGARTTNTMSEGLMQVLSSLATLKAAPDANLDEISGLESTILQILKRPQQEALAQLAAAGGVVPGGQPGAQPGQGGALDAMMSGGMSPGGMPMGGGPAPAPPAAGSPSGEGQGYRPWGVRNGGAMPPVDELRRLVGSTSLA